MVQNSATSESLPVSQPEQSVRKNPQAWYRPTISPEHGVYVMLLVSVLTGAAAAQNWTLTTTLALICAFCGFQAEHPLVLQVKQRRSLKPRFLFWAGLYASVAGAIAFYLSIQIPVLLWIYGGAIAALGVDLISVFYREQKSIANEIVTFGAVCLSAPLAYAATVGEVSQVAIGLWILNTLFFSSAIFTVKLRKLKTTSILPGLGYHAIATLIVAGLYWAAFLPGTTALGFGVAWLKAGVIYGRQDWYRTAKIQRVAMLETGAAVMFLILVALSVLPAHLPA